MLETVQDSYDAYMNKEKPKEDKKDLPWVPSPSIQPREGGRSPRF